MKEIKPTLESFDAAPNHTGSYIEAYMQKNLDKAVELKSQVAELRDYLIGSRAVSGHANLNTQEHAGLFGRLSEANASQQELLADISDIILEIRNYL